MAAGEIHKDDVDTRFKVTFKDDGTAVDITGGTITFWFKKPDNTVLEKSATISDGPNGVAHYDTVSGDLDLIGTWQLQGKAEVGSDIHHSDIHPFRVHRNLK